MNCKLSDVATIIAGGTPKTSVSEYWGGDIPWISVVDMSIPTRYMFNTERTITPMGVENSSTHVLEKDDLIISARGTVGLLKMVGRPMAFNQSCFGIRAKEGVNATYLYYCLLRKVDLLKQASNGSVFNTINSKQLLDMELSLPNHDIQCNIAYVLSILDDKISCNNKINDNLLVQLWSLYEHLIVKKSNDSIKIGDVAKIYSGGTPNTSNPDYWGGDYGWLSSGETRNRFILDTEKTITKAGIANSSTRLANELDTVIASAGQGLTRGQTSILFTKTYVNQSVIVVNSVEQYAYLVFCNLSRRYDELRTLSDSMSIRGSITTKMIADLEMLIVGTDQLDMFNNNAKDILSKIKVNISEIRVLKDLRDYILPKLMSGEIDVSTLEIPN